VNVAVDELPDEQRDAAIVAHLAARLTLNGLLCSRRCYVCDYLATIPADEQIAYIPRAAHKVRRDAARA
jgi:hypothetical protein